MLNVLFHLDSNGIAPKMIRESDAALFHFHCDSNAFNQVTVHEMNVDRILSSMNRFALGTLRKSNVILLHFF